MSIESEALRIKNNIANAYTVCEDKGATIPDTKNSANLAECIESIVTYTDPVISSLTLNPSTTTQTITAPSDIDGYSPITVNPVTSTIDSRIKASNIKSGITILGVTGTVEELKGQSKTITANGTYTPDSGFNGITNLVVDVAGAEDEDITPDNIRYGVEILGTYGNYMDVKKICNSLKSVLGDFNYILRSNGSIELITKNGTSLNKNETTITGATYSTAYSTDASILAFCVPCITTIDTASVQPSGFNGICVNANNLSYVDISGLTTLKGNGYYPFRSAFLGTNVEEVIFSSLSTFEDAYPDRAAFNSMFYNSSIKSVSFPAITSSNIAEGLFEGILNGTSECEIHFPSNLESTMRSWSSVTNGFGGTNTVVLFDLPTT